MTSSIIFFGFGFTDPRNATSRQHPDLTFNDGYLKMRHILESDLMWSVLISVDNADAVLQGIEACAGASLFH